MGNVKMNVGGRGGGGSASDTNFVGITVIHKLTPDEIGYWKGFDGNGFPEGLLTADSILTI